MNKKLTQRISAEEKGSVLMEFTLIFPIWLLLVLAIMQCSLILSARLVLQYAAFSAARAAVTSNDTNADADMYNNALGAARQVCALVLQEETANNPRQIPGWGTLRGSGSVDTLVTIPKDETVTVSSGGLFKRRRTRTTTRAIPIFDRDQALVKIHVDMEYPLVFPIVKAIFGHPIGQAATSAWDPFTSNTSGSSGSTKSSAPTAGNTGQPITYSVSVTSAPITTSTYIVTITSEPTTPTVAMYTISMAAEATMPRPFSYKN